MLDAAASATNRYSLAGRSFLRGTTGLTLMSTVDSGLGIITSDAEVGLVER